jgi:hypothetical protein
MIWRFDDLNSLRHILNNSKKLKQRKKIMGQLKNNPMMSTASGMVGDTIVFRQVRGKLVFANRPTKGRTLNEKQKATVQRFKNAAQYAKTALANADLKAKYTAGISGSRFTARLVAVSDYLNAPEVTLIDTTSYKGAIGNPIVVTATDDFMVTKVSVNILVAGAVIESGDAVQDAVASQLWKYVATAAATPGSTTIHVTAYDTAGNSTVLEKQV